MNEHLHLMPRSELTDDHCLDPTEWGSVLQAAPWRRLVVMGDSIAVGVGDPVAGYRDLSWAERLVEALGVGGRVAYRNLGVIGRRVHAIRRDQLPEALAFAPDLVVVSAGGNDVISGRYDPERVHDELEGIVRPLRESGADVVTHSLFDLSSAPFVPDEARRPLRTGLETLAVITEQVARDQGGIHVDFASHPASADGSIYSADRLHVNRRGHAIVATEIARGLVRHLAAGRAAHRSVA